MKQYLGLLEKISSDGIIKQDRTGTGTKSLFGAQLRFDLAKGFPAVTTKKLYLKGIIHELLWFLQGSSNIEYLVKNKVNIWNEWPYRAYLKATDQTVPPAGSDEWRAGLQDFAAKIATDSAFAKMYGNLGPVYGHQWRHWPDGKGGEIDQIAEAIETIKTNPDSRRIIVSAWNVADIKEMAISGLPPCHSLFQFYIQDGKLSCQLYQRSADMLLGVPFNIASYALLTMMFAQVCELELGDFVHTFGDAHIYLNHQEQVKEQLSRQPYALPKMKINPEVKDIFNFTIDDFQLENYEFHPAISAPIAI